jgi:two-component system nitrogen regulation response regulator GlnG
MALTRAFGNSRAVREVLHLVDKVAAQPVAVLLLGESGTGKELIARQVHSQSLVSQGPFVAINVAAIPATLLEAELFGVERGAFTGADERRIGRFELAQSGTLFLDEVGELPLEMQTKLLRVLESKEFSRVGGNESVTSTARIIAATNRSLESAVGEGRFRQDLFYRLNVFPIQLPPLRERKEDLAMIANDFAAREGLQLRGVEFSFAEDALRTLREHDWPGNVRELKNLVSRAVILSTHPTLTNADVAPLLHGARTSVPPRRNKDGSDALLPAPHTNLSDYMSMPLEELVSRRLGPFVRKFCEGPTGDLHELVIAQVERALFRLVLEQTLGNQVRASDILGINRNTLRSKLRALGVPANDRKSVDHK